MFIRSPVSFDLTETILPDIDAFNNPREMILLFVCTIFVCPTMLCLFLLFAKPLKVLFSHVSVKE